MAQGRTKGTPGMGSGPERGRIPPTHPQASQTHTGQQVVTSHAVTPSRVAAGMFWEPEVLEAEGARGCSGGVRGGVQGGQDWKEHPANSTRTG